MHQDPTAASDDVTPEMVDQVPRLPKPDRVVRSPSYWVTTFISWGLLIALVSFTFVMQVVRDRTPPETPESADNVVAADTSLSTRLAEMQGKLLVGSREMLPSDVPLQTELLNSGPLEQRLRYVVIVGEVDGPQEALEAIDSLRKTIADSKTTSTPESIDVLATLDKLYQGYAADKWSGVLTGSEASLLKERLGWFGSLALTPETAIGKLDSSHVNEVVARNKVIDPARMTFLLTMTAEAIGLTIAFVGFAMTVLFGTFYMNGRIQSNVEFDSQHGNVYIETFAVWFTLFLLLQFGALLFVDRFAALELGFAASALSLLALVWPLVRGVPMPKMLSDIGWTRGKHPIIEVGVGISGYLVTIPVALVLAFAVTMGVSQVQKAMNGTAPSLLEAPAEPPHPIANYLTSGDPRTIIAVLLAVAVAAPIVEETFFRGVLYRHLRDVSAGWRIAVSVAFSAVVNAFIFAIIHPQGWIGIAPLMTLAIGFSILREWRGSLIAPITAHAVNNLLVTTMMIVLLST